MGMDVNGEPVICFEVIQEIIKGKTNHDRETLIITYNQLKGYLNFWSNQSWIDNEQLLLIESVTRKFKKLLNKQEG
ncbi:hypothetical protein D3C72_2341090 [compost metagenome]